MNRIDDVDEQILALLREDGRLSNREVARRLGVSEGTVRQRLKKLEDAKFIRIGALVDPRKMGLPVSATVLVSVEPDHLESVLDAFCRMSEVHYVASVTGQFNVFVVLTTESLMALQSMVNSQIERFSGVHRVEVRLVVATKSQDYHVISIAR